MCRQFNNKNIEHAAFPAAVALSSTTAHLQNIRARDICVDTNNDLFKIKLSSRVSHI